MSQQAKDIYTGIKKIFPSAHRPSSLSFSSRVSAAALDSDHSRHSSSSSSSNGDVAVEISQGRTSVKKKKKKKTRPSSFSFSTWKKKDHHERRAPSESTPPVVMSLPYGATAATPRAKQTSDERDKSGAAAARSSLTQTLHQAFGTVSSHSRSNSSCGGSSTFFSSKKKPQNSETEDGQTSSCNNGHRGLTSFLSSTTTTSSTAPFTQLPPKLGGRSVSAGGDRLSSYSRGRFQLQPSGSSSSATAAGQTLNVCGAIAGSSHHLTSFSAVKTAPSTYQSTSSAISSLTAREESCGGGGDGNNSIVYSPKKKTTRTKDRGRALSFLSSSRRKKEEQEQEELELELETAKEDQDVYSKDEQEIVRPHAPTWDSDSDDDYENTKRPMRGLDRRSQSMDFMEQAPTHLIAKIWRKLPIQARLIGGRGNIDLDLQKDRTSFSRSSEARKFAMAAEKAKAAELQHRSISEDKVPSPASSTEDVLSSGETKRTRFNPKLTVVASDASDGAAGAYTAVESYDDVLVRVCKFAAHDQRPTTTKVQEFLERSLAFLHGSRTKHGNVVNISNGEIRMWRRLALHDWTLEEVTTTQAAAALGVKGKDVQAPLKRTGSSLTESTDSDSDSQRSVGHRRLLGVAFHRSLSQKVVEEEPEGEKDGEEVLDVPSNMKFAKLCDVINYCVNFGEVLFTPDEVSDLVRLEFIVEEDGWI
uniref:Protein kinase domain-containing protein n=1 Tax=Peronospora matthiolae TaxID=2874970 RepID=A0AAV1TTR8_9STRA